MEMPYGLKLARTHFSKLALLAGVYNNNSYKITKNNIQDPDKFIKMKTKLHLCRKRS